MKLEDAQREAAERGLEVCNCGHEYGYYSAEQECYICEECGGFFRWDDEGEGDNLTCPRCHGTGIYWDGPERCPLCDGEGYLYWLT